MRRSSGFPRRTAVSLRIALRRRRPRAGPEKVKRSVAHKKDAGFRKTRVESSRGVDVAFGGRPWRATRASANVRPQALTNPYWL